jgi:hypothetical protein
MFSVITNIHNKESKWSTLMELFIATGTLKTFYWHLEMFDVHHGWHGSHPYGIQVLSKHVSLWVHRYSSLLKLSVPLGQRNHVAIVGEQIYIFFPSTLFFIVVQISAARRCIFCSEKMAAPWEKLFCVLEYHTSKSVVTVQRDFVQSKQRTRIRTRPWVRCINNCSSEEYRCTHVDVCVARIEISYRCAPFHSWCRN